MNRIEIYGDGSATTGDKPGGWAAVILVDGQLHKELSGHLENSTNNDAELIALISGLEYVRLNIAIDSSEYPEIILFSDSQIALNWANGSFRFKQEEKLHLYENLRSLMKLMNVKTQWVKGHSGNKWNDRCDKLANRARLNQSTKDVDNFNVKADTRIGTKKNGVASLWYAGQLKIIDFETGIIENYNRDVHGKRGSVVEIREEKNR